MVGPVTGSVGYCKLAAVRAELLVARIGYNNFLYQVFKFGWNSKDTVLTGTLFLQVRPIG
jgi:hypothetical protein